MAQVAQAASRGVDWENLLVETLALLHRIAMVQLLPSMLDNHYAAVEQRLRELTRTLPPADVQLYYQTLLVGRKELAYAPDRRMGVEMTLLRALAFHPKAVIPEPVALVQNRAGADGAAAGRCTATAAAVSGRAAAARAAGRATATIIDPITGCHRPAVESAVPAAAAAGASTPKE